MTAKERKLSIQATLKAFATGDISENALALFSALGYNTDRQNPFTPKSYSFFKESLLEDNTRFNEEKAFVKEWKTVDLLFQLTRAEVSHQRDLFDTGKVDNTIIETLPIRLTHQHTTYSGSAT